MHPTPARPPHQFNDRDDRDLAVRYAAEFRAVDSPEALRDLDTEEGILLAFKLVRVARIAGWRPPADA